MIRRTAPWTALAMAGLLFGSSLHAQTAPETPARPHFDETSRTLLACGRLVARLPLLDRDTTCGEPDDRPSMIVGREHAGISFEPDYVELAIEIEEQPFDAALLAQRAAEFAAWPSQFTTRSPRLKMQRRGDGLEVRVDDGSVLLVRVEWPDGASYVDEDQPSAATMRRVTRDVERVTSQLVLTLEPGPVRVLRPGTVTFRDEEIDVRLAVPDGVLFVAPTRPAVIEPGCDARYELLQYGAPPIAPHAYVGVCRDGRVAHSPVVRAMSAGVVAALESVHDAEDPPPSPPTVAPQAPRTCRSVVNDPAPPLRVRASFSSRAEVVGTLENGTVVVIEERHGRWGRIASPAGWIWTENVEERCE